MRITIFTGNQPRHLSLINSLAEMAEMVYAVISATTLFPGRVAGSFRSSAVMQRYFERVLAAEQQVFGPASFFPENVRALVMKGDDLNLLEVSLLDDCLASDEYVVFGAPYIKGPLVEFLIAHRAYNIHMGVSPYYRGSSCNFWAAYDGRFDLVGATIHLLSKGLDSGEMLFHAFPESVARPFLFGMLAVKSAHQGFVQHLKDGTLRAMAPVKQDRRLEIRYTRQADFTDEVAEEYLKRLPSEAQIQQAIEKREASKFLHGWTSRNS